MLAPERAVACETILFADGTTTNGITFSRSLSPGVYSQLEMYYYTNHNCMYGKSNITYSVTFYFE